MQFDTPLGEIITQQQTITPFTTEVRIFNQKEANSTAGCIGGGSCNTGFDYNSKNTMLTKYIEDIKKGLKQLSNIYDASITNGDDKGQIRVTENFSNTSGEIMDPNFPNVVDIVYDTRLMKDDNLPSNFIASGSDDNYIDPTNPDIVQNAVIQDYTYNSYADNYAPTYNQWTRVHDDNCNEENRLRIASKPMKYYVNQFNSPQIDPVFRYTVIGNQKQYDVRNEYERSIPTRLNPIYPVQVNPYLTSPFLGATNPSRLYPETSEALRFGVNNMKEKKSAVRLSEIDYNRYDIVPEITVQNAGQFNLRVPGQDGYYDYTEQNNVLMGNSSSVPYFGISSRDLLHNIVELTNMY